MIHEYLTIHITHKDENKGRYGGNKREERRPGIILSNKRSISR